MQKQTFGQWFKTLLGFGPGEGLSIQTVFTTIYCIAYAFTGIFMLKVFMNPIPNLPFALTGDLVFFVILYIGSDLFSQAWGYKVSRQTASLCAVISLTIGLIGKLMTLFPAPAGNEWADGVFAGVYGSNFYITFCGIIIFFIGDAVNDIVFQKLRVKYKNDMRLSKFWLRSVGSSFLGRLVDLSLFGLLVNMTVNADTLGLGGPWLAIHNFLNLPDWGQTWFVVIATIAGTAIAQPLLETIFSPLSRLVCKGVMAIERKKNPAAYDKLQAEQSTKGDVYASVN